MPMTFEDLMQYADPMDIPVRPLRPAVRRRIARRVAQQLHPERKRRSLSRPLRAALIAAAALALLSATAFAAYSGGWFGFDRFFGAKSAELAPHVQTYAPPESAPETARPAEIRPVPDATPEQKARMAEGFLSMPNVAQADPETATAETGAFRCRLESLLATPDTMLAVMRVDALQEDAQRLLDTAWDPQIAFDNDLPLFLLKAVNAAPRGEGHAREYNNGAMRYIPMERDEAGDLALPEFARQSELAVESYELLAATNDRFSGAASTVKPLLLSEGFGYLGITGVYVCLTGESSVSRAEYPASLSFTMCHELAHSLAFAAEDEANFCAFLACEQSPSPILRYSGYYNAFVYCYNALHKADPAAAQSLWSACSEEVLHDCRVHVEYNQQYEGKVQDAAQKVNDTYLKAFHEEGVQSYGLVADYLIAHYLALETETGG